ncbi:class I SAM-dependent methyltransferase [Mesobacillus maritimus]|uniref:Methyltransferase domain-containing protein n=1 Tax=Mesobacillus maritimus TaxID=1643336 RepID=A0ABS7K6U2_9BACI|nr:class I SAM-dependent methyltransferase [Mesobacillus maritimus]MBY0097987.1 methyltransferase domain-containing protein [Mesobacillus maritimus]
MNNKWNKIIYTLWSPVYDVFFNTGIFLQARKKAFEMSPFKEGQKVLVVGVGTGAELEWIDHSKLDVTAIDYSPDMLNKAKAKFKDSSITFIQMDALQLNFNDESFDVVVGSLILSVVPNPNKAVEEMIRVVKPNGNIILFDKFAPKDGKVSVLKKSLRPIIAKFGTDIGINFEQLISRYMNLVEINEDIALMLREMYRKIILTKRTG